MLGQLRDNLRVLTISLAATDCQNRSYKPADGLDSSYASAGGLLSSRTAANPSSSNTSIVAGSGTTLPPQIPSLPIPLAAAVQEPVPSRSSGANASSSGRALPTPSLSPPLTACPPGPVIAQMASPSTTSTTPNIPIPTLESSHGGENENTAVSGEGDSYISPPASIVGSPASVNGELGLQDQDDSAMHSFLNPESYNLVGADGSSMITGGLLGLQGT